MSLNTYFIRVLLRNIHNAMLIMNKQDFGSFDFVFIFNYRGGTSGLLRGSVAPTRSSQEQMAVAGSVRGE